jgi:hypothetical protein
MVKESIGLKGMVNLKHYRDGRLIDERDVSNVIVNGGKTTVARLLLTDISSQDFDHIAIGTSDTTATATDTTLDGPVESRVAGTGSIVTVDVTNDTAQLVASFGGYASAYAVKESGIFNAITSGTMLCRQTFDVINLGTADTLEVTWKVTIS